jgi:hypothetical protein
MQRTASAPPQRDPVSGQSTTTPTYTSFQRLAGWTTPQLDETATITGSQPIVNNPQSSTSTLSALQSHGNSRTSPNRVKNATSTVPDQKPESTTKIPPEVAKELTPPEPLVTTPPNRCEWENCHIQFSSPEELIAHVKGPPSTPLS